MQICGYFGDGLVSGNLELVLFVTDGSRVSVPRVFFCAITERFQTRFLLKNFRPFSA